MMLSVARNVETALMADGLTPCAVARDYPNGRIAFASSLFGFGGASQVMVVVGRPGPFTAGIRNRPGEELFLGTNAEVSQKKKNLGC